MIKKIFFDSAPLMYFLDENSFFKDKTSKIFKDILKSRAKIITSPISCKEYLTYPYRNDDKKSIENFWQFIKKFRVNIRRIDNAVAVEAAKIRAEYRHFKTMDAFQLAAAVCNGCDLFLTNDKQLKQFEKISCMTVEEWS